MSKLNYKFPITHPGLDYLNSLEFWKGGGRFGVDKIAATMNHLGNPQDAIKTFHIAGTNGKGTTSAVLASILGATGAKVGLNTSPHLFSSNERIVIDGQPLSHQLMGDFALRVKEASEATNTVLSFHEGITATAFLAFKELGVDWNVIEVGLGGRFDASNIISKPVASIITTIDFDHQHILGDTKALIAEAKAGIIKRGCPVIVGALDQESLLVVENTAKALDSSVYLLNRDFQPTSFHDTGLNGKSDSFEFKFDGQEPFKIEKGIRGRHQVDNFSVALAAAKLAGVSNQACQEGVKNVFWPGRLEVFNWKNRTIIVDCAHNPHGVSALVDNLTRWGINDLDIAFGVLDGKNWKGMVEALIPFGRSWNLLTPNSERALDAGNLADYLSGFGVKSQVYGREFEKFIQNHDKSERTLLITGSIYMIGELRELFNQPERPIWNRY